MLFIIYITSLVAILVYYLHAAGYRLSWRYFPAKRFHPTIPYVPCGESESLVSVDKPFDQSYQKLLQKIVIPYGDYKQSFLERYFGLHAQRPTDKTIKELGVSVPPIFMLWFYGRSQLVIADPLLIKDVASRPNEFRKNPPRNVFRIVLGESVILTEGEIWKKHHDILKNLLRQSFNQSIIMESLVALRRHWNEKIPRKGSLLMLDVDIKKLVFQVMELYSFGFNFSMFKNPHPVYQDFNEIMHLLVNPPAWIRLTNIPEIKYVEFFKKTRAVLNRIHRHFDFVISLNIETSEGHDVLSQILAKKTQAEENNMPFPYTMKDIKDDMLALFFAGHETTGSAICIIIYYMCKYPDWQDDIRKELKAYCIAQVASEAEDAPVTTGFALIRFLKTSSTSSIQETFPLLGAFIAEATRLIPGVGVTLTRVATTSDSQIGPYKIPKGQEVLLDFYSSNRSPIFDSLGKYDTNEFHPERFFLPDAPTLTLNKQLLNKMANFSFGPHTCLGNTFALLQMHIVTIFCVHNYYFKLPEGSPHAERLQLRSRTSIFSPINFEVMITPITL